MANTSSGKFLDSAGFTSFMVNVDTKLSKVENALSMFLFIVMTVSVLINIVLRYIFKIPNLYGEEIARYAFILVVYMGCSICVKEDSHLGVEVFINKLKEKTRGTIRFIVDIVVTGTYVLLIYLFVKFALRSIRVFQVTPAMRIPFYWLHSIIAFCFVLCLVRSIMRLWDRYISTTHPLNKKEVEVEL